MKVFPNPAKDKTNLLLTLHADAVVKILIFNPLGKQVMQLPSKQFTNGYQSIEINTSKLTKGVYIISLFVNDQVITKRFIISG